jgi:transcriptional regulator with XRE-family HTH domain
MREEFGSLLRSFRERAKRSRNNLAKEVGVDPSYLCRIEAGDREPPRLHVVVALGRGLRLSLSERNRLFIAAGYAPVELETISWEGALQAVADVLSDVHLSPKERDRFSDVIQSIALRWRGAPVQERVTNGAHP